MNAWWQLWSGFFKPDVCQRIIDHGLTIPGKEGNIGHGGTSRQVKTVRSSTVRWIDKNGPLNDIYTQIVQCFQTANKNAFFFDLDRLKELQFTEYRARPDGTKDHYGWHEDLSWTTREPIHRKLSLVVQLSDPGTYIGGDLELEREPPTRLQLRKQGTVIVFPSFHKHRVTPVEEGVRYSLVGWYEGPCFR